MNNLFKDSENYLVRSSKFIINKMAGDKGEIKQCVQINETLTKKVSYYGTLSKVDKKWIIL